MKHNNNHKISILILWFQILFTPKEALNNIPRKKLMKYVILIGLLYGTFYNIGEFLEICRNPIIPIVGKIIIGLIRSVMPIIIIYIMSGIIYFTGQWLGGKGKWKDILRVLPWSFVPLISIEICIAIIALLLNTVIRVPNNENFIISLGVLLFLLIIIGSIWSIRTNIIFLSKVQRYSKFWAFLNMVFTFLLAIIPLLILF